MSRFILTISLILVLFGGVSAGIIKVPENYATIQAGIDAAVKGDTVLVNAGTYYENINFKGKAITVASHFIMDSDTTHINNTIINGSKPSDPNKGSVVSFVSGEDTTSVICGFTITGGTGTLYDATYRIGGGIYCKNSGARILHNKIVHNSITHNQECNGGGIGVWPIANRRHVIIEDNVIGSNSLNAANRVNGGGIRLTQGRIIRNKINANVCHAQVGYAGGGGVSAWFEETASRTLVKIIENVITNNQAISDQYTIGGYGGGIDNVFCNIELVRNVITHNLASGPEVIGGGGVRIRYSKDVCLVKNNIISFNSCNITMNGYCNGGGMNITWGEHVLIQGNRFEGNEGTYGGGLGAAHHTSCVISGNEFIGNTADWGGGINEWDNTQHTVMNNLFVQNTALYGGGGYWSGDCDVLFTNNILIKNESQRGGGADFEDDPLFEIPLHARVINNTFTENVADTAGGIFMWDYEVVAMNNICWGNDASLAPEILVLGGELNIAHSDIKGGAANIATEENGTVNWLAGNIDTNPLFEISSYQLSNSSPCIGAGTEGFLIGGTGYYCPGDDFAGNPRPDPPESENPDIGAYENPLDKPIAPILVPEKYASIQAGINAAKDGEIVLVKDGTYYENINFKGKAITVVSYYLMDGDTTHINNTIIDGSQPTHADSGSVVFFISGEDTTSVLCGFTITGGTGTEATPPGGSARVGGGIFCYNSGARIINNKIIENTVHSPDKDVYGGGLAALPIASTAYVILQDNQISHNTLTADSKEVGGGGVELMGNGILVNNLISYNSIVHNASDYLAFSGGVDCFSLSTNRRKVIVESNKITHNSVVSKSNVLDPSATGGGISFVGSYGRCAKNEVSDNEVWANSNKGAGGAGIFINWAPASLIIEGNIIRKNMVKRGYGYGGGVLIGNNSSPMVINNIIEGNSATVGGGFIIAMSTPQLINNTVINNRATSGGGINVRMSSTVYLMNNIVWGNQATNYAGIQREDGTVNAAYCDIQGGWTGTGNINADPLFADTLFHLSDKSPCIGAGISSFDFGGGMVCNCPPTDYDGNPRPNPVDEFVDMGAFESEYARTGDDVAARPEQMPTQFSLAQNYPNPFNPSTTIEFALPKPAFVTLKVYNMLGEEVATLVAEQRLAGIHKLIWNVRGLASGVYLYRLEAGDFAQAKKLILMR